MSETGVAGPIRRPAAVSRKSILFTLSRMPWFAIILLAGVLFTTMFAPWLTPYDPSEIKLQERFTSPTLLAGGHVFGTDTLGRDLLTRIYYGGRISLFVSLVVLAIGGTVGLTLGIIAGYMQGIVGVVIMRLVDSLMALPGILIALVFAVTLGPSVSTVIIAITVTLWARFARVIRGEVLSLVNNAYVLQARVAGCSQGRIMCVHILPNVFNTFLILVSLNVGQVILMEASLSFLGAGIPPPTPSWGQMVAEGRGYITSAWWISFFPGLALALTVLALNMLGDWLRDKLDPKLRQL